MIRAAAAEGVVLFTLPPHTTHLCQLLDKGPFASLKLEWRNTVRQFVASNPGRTVTRYDFSALFAETWFKVMTMKNITAGFRVTGVCPFNKHAVRLSEVKTSSNLEDNFPASTDIKYIPLYSPHPPRIKSRHNSPTCMVKHSTPNDRLFVPRGKQDDHNSYPLSAIDSPSMGSYTLDKSTLECSVSESDLQDLKCFLPVKKACSLQKFLMTPVLPTCTKQPGQGPKPTGRDLTSRENMMLMEEKERESFRKRGKVKGS